MHAELISFSPLYCNENATRETTREEHFSEHLFMCLKVQTLVLLITVKTSLGFWGRCFSLLRFCGRAAVMCVLSAGDGLVSKQRRLCPTV